jgi:hypothetical protein
MTTPPNKITAGNRHRAFPPPLRSNGGTSSFDRAMKFEHHHCSKFVQSVADEFFSRYDLPVARDDSDGELWIECRSLTPERFRSPLTFGITSDSVTVAFDGLTLPFIIHPGRDAKTAQRQAFALFDDLITERQVAISFWRGDECDGVEFISHEQIRARQGYAVRVRSWLGKYDHDFAA